MNSIRYYIFPTFNELKMLCCLHESPKFCRHAGLDPASSFIMLLKLLWILAFAGMTSRMNQDQEYQCVKRTLDSQVIYNLTEYKYLVILYKMLV